ncbi:hypothetical protein BH23VER1_BH23VER1_30310 [soil metagenome]
MSLGKHATFAGRLVPYACSARSCPPALSTPKVTFWVVVAPSVTV